MLKIAFFYDNIFDMKGCICHFVKWQIHPFMSKVTNYVHIKYEYLNK